MKTLKQALEKIHWVEPNGIDEYKEVTVQERDNHEPSDVKHELDKIDNEDAYAKFIKKGKLKKIKPSKGDKIENFTSDAGDYQKLDATKRKNVEAEFKTGYVHAPILFKDRKTKELYLLAGNTKLAYCFQILKKPAKCWIIKYN